MDDDATKYKIPSAWVLKITEGFDKGKILPLYSQQQYTIGRASDCEIVIDKRDKRTSRRHALLTVEKRVLTIENLSKTNPIIIDGKKIVKISLKKGGQFQLGSTVFMIESYGDNERSLSSKRLKLMGIAAGIILIFIATLVIITKEPPSQKALEPPEALKPSVGSRKLEHENKTANELSAHEEDTIDEPSSGKPANVRAADSEKTNAHFRKGIFFYDAGKLKKAIDEWDRVLIIDPAHLNAKKWLLRAEDELETLINKHYQRALLHSKYMQYGNAISEFRTVVELSRSKDDERYQNSVKQLKELEGR